MNARIESVDILRGFAIVAMILVNTPGTTFEEVKQVFKEARDEVKKQL